MKLSFVVFFALLSLGSLLAQDSSSKILFVFDEHLSPPEAFPMYFRNALLAKGFSFEEATAEDLKKKDITTYDHIVMYGMVQAFNMKSPLRDWLKTKPDLHGKKISLFVTANRWFLQNLFTDLQSLLKKNNAIVIDAVSMATKDIDNEEKQIAVSKFVQNLSAEN